MKRSLALSLSLLCSLVLCISGGCDKKKGPSEEPTRGDAEGEAGGAAVVVEEPGEEPEDAVDPIDRSEQQYEGTVELVAGAITCETDEDCVPQECCHPSTCGAPSTRPDCSATMCTMECKSGSMDCFGGCLCGADKKCAANIWTASPT